MVNRHAHRMNRAPENDLSTFVFYILLDLFEVIVQRGSAGREVLYLKPFKGKWSRFRKRSFASRSGEDPDQRPQVEGDFEKYPNHLIT